MNKYPLGRDILVSWSLDLGGQPVDEFLFEYNCAGGTKAVSDFNISNGVLTWNFLGEEQHAYGVYGLHLIALFGGEKVAEFKLKDAFEIIHGIPSDEEQSVPLESSVETEQEPFEPEEPEETIPNYVSQAPLHVEKVPLGSNIILNWKLLSAEIFDFPLEQCQLDLFYAAAGSGYNRAEDYELKTDDGYVLQWNFAAEKQVRFGLYSLFLDIHYNGERIATLVREAAFSLVHRSGSGILPDRIISFESVVTTLGGGALYALADVVNDGYSTVYRNDGSTPAASGDSLVFNGEKWAASNALLLALQDLRSQIDAVSRRVDGTDFDLDGLSSRLDGAISAIEQNTAWIQADEDSIAQLIVDANRILASVEDIYGNIAQLEITSSSISTRVSNAEGDISTLQQTAQGFDLRVSNAEGDIGELYLTAEWFGTRISDAEGNISTLEQTAESLTSSIEDAEGNISVLQQTATTLTSAISDAEGNISVLQQTAAGLESRVEDAEGDISTISQTAESIQLQVDSQSGDIATLQVSARGLTSRVANAEGDISTLDQRADAIEVSVQGISTDLAQYEIYVDGVIEGIQEQIDGAIDTWFYDYAPVHTDAQGVPDSQVPLTNVSPYADWLAEETRLQKPEEIRNEHVSDIFYDTSSGYAYRFIGTGEAGSRVYTWVPIEDSAVVKALEDAAKAQDTADSKRRVFLVQPTPPYDAGDLWVKEVSVGGNTTREIYRCTTSRASGSFNSADWGPADDYGYIVNKSNLEVLSNAIAGTSTQISYNADGTIDQQSTAAMILGAGNIRLQVANGAIDTAVAANGKIAAPLLGTGIDIVNGDITLIANHIALKNQNDQTGLELVTIGSGANAKVVIDVASLNVSGIFTTSAWLGTGGVGGERNSVLSDAETAAETYANSSTYLNAYVLPMIQSATSGLAVDSDYSYLKTALENQTTALGGLMLTSLIQLGATQSGSSWTVNSGISGVYDSTKRGNGIAAWFGGPMVDHLASPATTPYAASLFRMDGSGYLAGGEIQWGASGELIIHGTSAATPITIENAELKDGNKTLSVGDLILNIEDLLELKSWFVKETYDPGDGQTHYRLKLVGSSTGIEGLHVEGHILSDDDQIVGGGTPGGGGGGGAQYLTDLIDVYPSTKPSAQKILVFDPNQNDKDGNPGAWVYANMPSGSVTSVVGQTGDVTAAQISSAIGLGNYLPLAGGTMTGALKMSYTYQSGASYRFINNRAVSGGSGWADDVFNIYNAAESYLATIGVYGNADALTYLYIGSNNYNGVNLRINSSSIKWGDNDILHAGNYTSYTPILNSASTHATNSSVIYAPTTAGTNGYVLTSNGSGAPGWTAQSSLTAGKATADGNGNTISSTYLPRSGGSSYPMTGDLYLTAGKGIEATGGAGLLVYRPATDTWTGVSNTQWAVGALDSQGVIRSSNADLIHCRNGSNYTIWDGSNAGTSTTPWTCSTLTTNGGVTIYESSSHTYRWTLNFSGTTGRLYAINEAGTAYNDILINNTITVTSGYNVGIGTSSPAYKLHVVGTGYFSDNVTLANAKTLGGLDTGGTRRTMIGLDTDNAMYVGWGVAGAGYTSYYCGSDLRFMYGTGHNEAMRINSSGYVGIGTNSPSYKLHVSGSAAASKLNILSTSAEAHLAFSRGNANYVTAPSGGGVYFVMDGKTVSGANSTLQIFGTYCHINGYLESTGDQVISSDATLKTNWRELNYGVSDIAKCTAGVFDWKESGRTSAGSKAQDWKPLIPELVHGEEGNMTLAYGQIALVNTIIEAREIDVLKKRVAELEEEVQRLRMN